jgi:NAD(P)-dependent dehydrogenase (short-subunit alcohol dehydrogenase family)
VDIFNSMTFSGHTAVVTGGRGALGEAIVRRFLDAGARVAVPVRPADPARPSSHESHPGSPLRLTEPNLFEGPCDVTNAEDVRGFFSAMREAWGDPDILVHAAGGYAGGRKIEETSAAMWEAMLSTNLRSAYLFAGEALPGMRRKGFGRLVFVSAYTALRPTAGSGAYAVSKRGLITLVEVLAEEVKGSGITANAVAPTILRTEANRKAMPDGDAELWVSVGELAGAILTLCSPESGAINGTTLTVRGGL